MTDSEIIVNPVDSLEVPTELPAVVGKESKEPKEPKQFLLPEAYVARLKEREERKKATQQRAAAKAAEKKKAKKIVEIAAKLDELKTESALLTGTTPPALVPHQWKPGESGNPGGKPKTKYIRDSIEKVIAQARTCNHKDPLVVTKLDALLHKIYEKAMDKDADLDEILEAAKFISERLDGKPAQDVEDAGSQKPALTININATRFAIPVVERIGDVIDVSST